jgi:hypothetical protein
MYCHTQEQVNSWLVKNKFRLDSSVEFTVWMDKRRTKKLPARAYLAQKVDKGN